MSNTNITMMDIDQIVLGLTAEGVYVSSGKGCCLANAREEMEIAATPGQPFVLFHGNAIADSFGEAVAYPELLYLAGVPMRVVETDSGIALEPLSHDEAAALEFEVQQQRETTAMVEQLPVVYGINDAEVRGQRERAVGRLLVSIARSVGVRVELEGHSGSAIIHPARLSVAA